MEDAKYGALISQEGEVPDFIKLSYLLRRREAYIEKERQGKADDMHNLKLFIKQKKPHVNAIAKRANPAKIQYFFSASKELSGKFMLTYMPRAKVRHEFITVTPDGSDLGDRILSLLGLMKWFEVG